ncbi:MULTISPECIES: class I SAM-dependent methyltransferase [Nitrosomonas]|uniref:Methyltransferase family protein n=1 Tax=Nitrosomonas communis TaxID=44574 RepID=A0A0F7KHB6_9PROT|nr:MULTISPECIES: class I SAM-dependent methyltransferase [Nitrosomonas]AKH38237.1 methyltransferase type 11 [Nitrosomonas communis]TYP80655.1 methyltransferase family protein [Nitrosomonas communis]UVS60215.1 class I SAM-dependent methyltransferase [Nitrosomonas sp. PLL12]
MPHRWCTSAGLRQTQIESGADITFNEVFKPLFIQRICALKPKRVIEVGAGTGHLSKAISGHGFSLTTIEPSEGMFRIAQEVLSGENVILKNCSSFTLPLSETFDVAFSHMVAHVVEDMPGFFNSIAIHLSQEAHFIFSIPHPCFYNSYKKFFGEEYNYMKRMMKVVSFSITRDPDNLISGVPYHHRPLSDYINALVDAGFALDGFDEIYPPEKTQRKYGELWESPRYCVFVCRKL